MNEWLRKVIGQIGSFWAKWSLIQKLVFFAICAAMIVGVIALFTVSSSPAMVSVIDAPIRDEAALDRIVMRINQEGVRTQVTPTGVVQVQDQKTAQRMRSILIREDLIPSGIDPWQIFDRERWTITDFERKVNLRRAITQMVRDHIKALDEVDDASVTIVMPETRLLRSEQNPVTASVTIIPKPGSEITRNRKQIEGIQKILKFAVEGLQDENIVITDNAGNVLNDFAGLEDFERLGQIERQNKIISNLETKYRAIILESLQKIYTADRVRDLNIKIEMDMSKKSVSSEEFLPTVLKPRTPGLPYDDSQMVPSITRSKASSQTSWEGSGFNPEGPAGVEGQTPPVMRDMQNLFGKVDQETLQVNEEISSRKTEEIKSPSIDRLTVSVNIDGIWTWKYNEKNEPIQLPDGSIEREYTALSSDELRAAQLLIQNGIGFNAARGDAVTVQNIRIDRTKQFRDEDAAYFRQKQSQTMILIFLSGVVLLLIAFVLFRFISREMERRRRLAEEERSRREQALREQALMNAEEEGVDVSISVEERARMELQEAVANMAREHPEDVAQLIRTWLLEE
ncbi:MAG: flagellar M-ring protein FliF [Treponema sp.]|nr:flagellar M-ring protein FliF [Treponema sp.]